MNWRWDQGRLEHFSFENIRTASRALLLADGADLASRPDPLRQELNKTSTAVFKPVDRDDYPVWRNHKRVFECSLIATKAAGLLRITDIGTRLATDELFTADDYLSLIVQRFRYPFPAFQDYDPTATLCFPFCAALKYLFARFTNHHLPLLIPNVAGSYIIGNSCSGLENLSYYSSLTPTTHTLSDVAARQVREMLIFVSQLSFLKWDGNALLLDINSRIPEVVLTLTSPDLAPPLPLQAEEMFSRGRLSDAYEAVEIVLPGQAEVEEAEFSEGQKVRRSHLRTERSSVLKKMYFQKFAPTQCAMCQMDVALRYPWALSSLLELHHLLPLASALTISNSGTLLTDVVPLCPTCHRAVHSYYRLWLNKNNRQDFVSKPEAKQVYEEAKTLIVLT